MTSLKSSNSAPFSPMTGGCYCGLITYTLTASPIFVNCCHCRNCQKLSGSAFAINIMVEAANVRVTSDTQPREIHDQDSKDSEAARCPRDKCGTLLWATHPHLTNKIIFLRAGTLDQNDEIVPDAHFFLRSKHPWVTVPAGAVQFDGVPGKDDPPIWDADTKRRMERATQVE
ncbi:hypothetical protein B0A52_02735 [Exophiala mesophila]|uniref:CENP-V/GFA domain-containing protein n=1 Tax=Exophiala mesophila TaxID=212818 RepID=A0A438NDW3_EXOME|nr:hypothetical protein B0A52_02735 [Exophiala mesophila]